MKPLTEEEQGLRVLYDQLAHALQTGVAVEQHIDPTDGEPKHLRVGVNLRATDMAGLVTLLIDKGVITRTEYFRALVDSLSAEVAAYEARLSQLTEKRVKLI